MKNKKLQEEQETKSKKELSILIKMEPLFHHHRLLINDELFLWFAGRSSREKINELLDSAIADVTKTKEWLLTLDNESFKMLSKLYRL